MQKQNQRLPSIVFFVTGLVIATIATAATERTWAAAESTAVSSRSVSASRVDDPQRLVQDEVFDSSGKMLGVVEAVNTGNSDRALQVKVKLEIPGALGRVASIRADKLTYDRTKNVLWTDLSTSQLNMLAAAPSGGGRMPNTVGTRATNY